MTRRHYVHVYATVRVKVEVDAQTHLQAMQIADRLLFDNRFAVRLIPNADCVLEAEYAEEVTGYLVEEADDPEFASTRNYDRNHEPDEPGAVADD